MEHNLNEYLSEEELQKLIDETNEHEMLKAPSYMKTEILTRVQAMEVQKTQTVGKQMTYEQKKKAFRIYRIKVAAVAAAAIFALFLIPKTDFSPKPDAVAGKSVVTETINDKTNEFCSRLFEFSNGIISPEQKD